MGNGALEEKIALMEERLAFLEKENERLGKAKDVHEIQNVMSLHEYYHSACKHQEELDAIWAQKADDVAFEEALFQARFVGLEAIKTYYVDFMRNTLFRSALDLTRTLFPQLKDDPEEELRLRPFVHAHPDDSCHRGRRGPGDGQRRVDLAGLHHHAHPGEASGLLALGSLRSRFHQEKTGNGRSGISSWAGNSRHPMRRAGSIPLWTMKKPMRCR